MADSNRGNGRDEKGRFARGNSGGPGNPHLRRLGELQQAVADAVKPKDLRDILAKLLEQAKQGDQPAARIVLDRVLGKPGEAPQDAGGIDFALPVLRNAEDCVSATGALLAALSDARLTPDNAVKLSGIIELARRAIETAEIEQRLRVLEQREARY
jgi:hypothetical protein